MRERILRWADHRFLFSWILTINYSFSILIIDYRVWSGDECVEETVYWWREFLPKSKDRLGCKNKGFLTVCCNYNEHKQIGRKERIHCLGCTPRLRGIYSFLLYTLFWPYRTMYHLITQEIPRAFGPRGPSRISNGGITEIFRNR